MQLTQELLEEEGGSFSEARKVLETYAEWLNGWHKRNGEEDLTIGLKDYWLDWTEVFKGTGEPDGGTSPEQALERWGNDGPELLLDTRSNGSSVEWDTPGHYWMTQRMMVIRCSPYHDEGGPAVLTAMFEWLEEGQYRGVGTEGEAVGSEGGCWSLRALVTEFDTIHSMVMTEGKLVWEEYKGEGSS